MIIFGGMGDLAMRKLLPALYMAYLHGNLPPSTRIRPPAARPWRAKPTWPSSRSIRAPSSQRRELSTTSTWQSFLQLLDYVALDVQAAPDFAALAAASRAGAPARVLPGHRAHPVHADLREAARSAGLVDAQRARGAGKAARPRPGVGAVEINEAVGAHFAESQIYRIDHYLGKETVQNLMVLRFGNAILEPLWRAPNISSVQITVAEEVGVGSRAGFYDSTGAMRDMVQNHLLQLLCIVAMEPPTSLDAGRRARRKTQGAALAAPHRAWPTSRAIRCAASTRARRQRQPGSRRLPGRATTCRRTRSTETFVALRAHIDTWRWSKVPFYLRTGKRMARRSSKIVIEFANPPFPLFPGAPGGVANRLVIELQPEEAIKLQIMAKEPGSGMHMQQVALNLDLQSAFQQRRAEAYERLLIDVVRGRLTHFMRRDELEAAWAWADPIIDGWGTLGEKPHAYAAGSWGPPESFALLARDGFSWVE